MKKIDIGWKEWIALPELNVDRIKAKIDTGAATSALHAEDICLVPSPKGDRVGFKICPFHDESDHVVYCELPLHDERIITSSNGAKESRYVIKTPLKLGELQLEVEFTLTNRSLMRFNVLLGRQALKKFAIINPAKSFLQGE